MVVRMVVVRVGIVGVVVRASAPDAVFSVHVVVRVVVCVVVLPFSRPRLHLTLPRLGEWVGQLRPRVRAKRHLLLGEQACLERDAEQHQ